MMRLKVITWTFLAIYAVMVLATIAFPLAAAFVSWNLSFFDDKAIYVLSLLFRLELVMAAFMALVLGFNPDIIQAAHENKLAKDILKAKRKML
jgi:hypothetical protein